jgi:hypothetical protein
VFSSDPPAYYSLLSNHMGVTNAAAIALRGTPTYYNQHTPPGNSMLPDLPLHLALQVSANNQPHHQLTPAEKIHAHAVISRMPAN